MDSSRVRRRASPFLADYGMALVLLLLCAFFGVVTRAEQHPTGVPAARQLARAIAADPGKPSTAVIVVREGNEDASFADALRRDLQERGVRVLATVRGQPADARRALTALGEKGEAVGVLACNQVTSTWGVYEPLKARFPALTGATILKPESYVWPNFLKADNLLNIANQIAVIAIIAVGMTMVII